MCQIDLNGQPKQLFSFFDEVEQAFHLPILDQEEQKIDLKVSYSEETKELIQALEWMEKDKQYPESILVRVWIESTKICVYPISGYFSGEKVINWTLD